MRYGSHAVLCGQPKVPMSNIDSRLKELGITLPTPPAPVASYVP